MTTKKIALLNEKMRTLGTALFFCDNQYDLAYAAHIIEVDSIDAEGNIWLHINKHGHQGVKVGEPFPVTLDFYRKGMPYTIDVKGIATIENLTDDKLIIKVIPGRVQYHEFVENSHPPVMEAIGRILKQVFEIPQALDEFKTAA
ncbi:MAG: hypothetical protein QM726_23150 [Chitinophagaceae bacterium]